MKRIFCFLLAMLMMSVSFFGCNKAKEENGETAASTQPQETETINPYDVQDDLGDLKFGTEESPVDFTVMQWDSYDPDWCIDPSNKDSSIVLSELYERQLYMEERFGIAITFVEVKGKYNSMDEINKKIETSVTTGLHAYDLVGHYSVGASLNVMSGYSYNLLEINHLDLSKSYWPADMLESNTVNDQMYFLTGYLAPSYFGNIAAVFYNQNTIEAMSFENPVELVDNNQWTFEKLEEMTANMYTNVNTDIDGVDRDDTFGLVFNQTAAPIDALSVACGVRMMDIGSDGRLRLSSSCYSTKGVGIIDDLKKFVMESEGVFLDRESDGDFGGVFSGGRAMFSIGQLNDMATFTAKATFKIGAVPMPKYNTSQERFYSSVGPQFTLFTVPADAKDPHMTGAVLEALESYSYRNVFPLVYEEIFKVRYAIDQDMSRMVTLIYESTLLDPAKMWGNAAALYWVARSSISDGGNWSQKIEENRDTVWKASIDALNKYLFHET